MNLPVIFFPLLLAGFAAGIIFYGGLWLTVRSLVTTRHPIWLTLVSFWIRTLVVLGAFLILMRGRWQYALICLLGFAIGRLAVSRYLIPAEARSKCP